MQQYATISDNMQQYMTILHDNIAMGIFIKANVTILLTIPDNAKKYCAVLSVLSDIVLVIVQKFPEQTACFSLLAPLFPDNVHYFPTISTIPRQRPIFPDNVHYSPTCSTFSRQKGSIFANTFLTRLRSQPSETFHFPFRVPRPAPPRLELLPASPAARPLIPPALPPAHK
jgi:hypothetical protein